MVDRGLKNAPNCCAEDEVWWKILVPAALSRQSPSQVRDGGGSTSAARGHGWQVSATEYVP